MNYINGCQPRRSIVGWVLAALLVIVPAAYAQQVPAGLTFFKNYFVTGDYVVASVGLKGKGVKGLATGNITIDSAQIPPGAQIVAAYLYWQTVGLNTGAPSPAGAKFNQNDISNIAVLLNPGGSPACTTSSDGGDHDGDDDDHARTVDAPDPAHAVYVYRADVLPFIPRYLPSDTTQPVQVAITGKHQVTLPDSGSPTVQPTTLGASLVVVYSVSGYSAHSQYRLPNQALKSIVLYNGGATVNPRSLWFQVRLQGFYEASRNKPEAKLTAIVGNGRPGLFDGVLLADTFKPNPPNQPLSTNPKLVALAPFQGLYGGFDAPTWRLPLDPGAMKADVTFAGLPFLPCGCLTFGAVVMSTAVQDRDQDGLLDVWEAQSEWANKPPALAAAYSSWPLTDPNGLTLPNLQAMGANPNVQDVFVQIDWLVASDHTHAPDPQALYNIATAFHNAAPRPSLTQCTLTTPGACPINIHFDLGSNSLYYAQFPTTLAPPGTFNFHSCATSWSPYCAIVPTSAGAIGGSPIPEQSCIPNPAGPGGILLGSSPPKPCAFPNFAGAVGWKSGLRGYRDQPVDVATHSIACASSPGVIPAGCEPRLPHTRKDIFHYALFAHALGYPTSASLTTPPLVPRTNSGVADAPGGDLMVTLGLWGAPILDGNVSTQNSSVFVQGSTLMHELGHNLGLRHGGVIVNGTGNTVIEPNCKPNYQSVMNYLFQVQGLLGPNGSATMDYSRQQLGTLTKTALSETTGMTDSNGLAPFYEARWYAPETPNTIAAQISQSPSARHCDGTPLGPNELSTNGPYVRLDASTLANGGLDWNDDGTITGTQSQDINYDNKTGETFTGADDFWTMDLRQVGSRRAIGSFQLSYSVIDPKTLAAPVPPAPAVGGGLSLDTGYGDLGFGDLGYGDLGYGDLGYGDLGYGDLGYGDLGYGDLGYGDLGAPAENPPGAEGDVTFEAATAVPATPTGLTTAQGTSEGGFVEVVLNWTAAPVGRVCNYAAYRFSPPTPVTLASFVGTTNDYGSGVTTLIDNFPPGAGTYTYFVVAQDFFGEGCGTPPQSGPSNFSTITLGPGNYNSD
jgi:hypothetical protein